VPTCNYELAEGGKVKFTLCWPDGTTAPAGVADLAKLALRRPAELIDLAFGPLPAEWQRALNAALLVAADEASDRGLI
jgi:hypothetical protein